MGLLTDADNDAIRALVDLSLDSTVLPDATIALPVFRPAADLEVQRRDPNWATRTGDNLQHLRNAAMLIAAALLLPALPPLILERAPDGSQYQRSPLDVPARVAELRGLADQEIGVVLDGTAPTTLARPLTFAVAPGARGQ